MAMAASSVTDCCSCRLTSSAPLFNYVAAHNDVAVSAVRLAPLSSVMGGGFDLTQDAVEMSAAEVGARR